MMTPYYSIGLVWEMLNASIFSKDISYELLKSWKSRKWQPIVVSNFCYSVTCRTIGHRNKAILQLCLPYFTSRSCSVCSYCFTGPPIPLRLSNKIHHTSPCQENDSFLLPWASAYQHLIRHCIASVSSLILAFLMHTYSTTLASYNCLLDLGWEELFRCLWLWVWNQSDSNTK